MIEHSKKFGVYHWDTFDNETIFVAEFDDLEEAANFVKQKYNISSSGADQVDVVDLNGNVVRKYAINS